MVPTRELAVQIAAVFHDIGKNLDVNIVGIFGGVEQEQQIEKLEKGVDVLIATPGRMFDLINQQKIDLAMLKSAYPRRSRSYAGPRLHQRHSRRTEAHRPQTPDAVLLGYDHTQDQGNSLFYCTESDPYTDLAG